MTDERLARCLYLYPADGGKPQIFELPDGVDEPAVQRSLEDCGPGQFASVPALFVDQVSPMDLHVRPDAWGCWVIADTILKARAPR